MQSSNIITSLLCGVSPFVIGWIAISVIVGFRGGWEAGIRLFSLGLGLFGAILAIGAILFYLPDWATVILISFGAILPWFSTLSYFVALKVSGRLLMALRSTNEKWSLSIMNGAFLIMLALPTLISHDNNFISPAKSYVLSIGLISMGIFRIIQRVRYTQIREKGILYELGNFYKWENLENYSWKLGEDKLSLKLKSAFFKRNVKLKILSQFRQEVVQHLLQNAKIEDNNTKEYVPFQKPG